MKWLRRLWSRLVGWWRGPPSAPIRPVRTAARVEELPDALDPTRVYLVGERAHLWSVAMLCPCGCGADLHMNLVPGNYACWSVVEHEDETVSLSPSVNRTTGCRSHFFLRRGAVEWCHRLGSS